jgi:hypothetical protein
MCDILNLCFIIWKCICWIIIFRPTNYLSAILLLSWICDAWCSSHRGAAEKSSIPGCDSVIGWVVLNIAITVPSSSRLKVLEESWDVMLHHCTGSLYHFKGSQDLFTDCLKMEMKELQSYKMLGTTQPTTQHYMPKELILLVLIHLHYEAELA